MSRKSFSLKNGSDGSSKLPNINNILILEKALEQNGQDWIENLNIIEQFLVRVIDRLGVENPTLKSKFIIRRLPTYLSPFINKNEYGIVLQNIHFTITPPTRSRVSADQTTTSTNFGQTEIFHAHPYEHLLYENNVDSMVNCPDDLSKEANVLNEYEAFCSHEIFKRFTAAFVDAYQSECEISSNDTFNQTNTFSYSGDVQLIAAHLLRDVKENSEITKIFKLNQPPLPMPKNLKARCAVNVNYLKSTITVNYDNDTEVIVRPCLFHINGFPKVNANILERIPLHHQSYLQIGESLQKGFLLFPTSFETVWNLQFWPSESHIISSYHPSSIVSRVFKLYSAFCQNPLHFWETINTTFLVGIEDDSIQSFRTAQTSFSLIPSDFVMSSFCFELENFSHIEAWAPRNFSTRLMHLMKTAVDCFYKGFHAHYFTKINVLRGIWKNGDNFDTEEKSVLRELDDINEDLDDYGERAIMAIDDLEDDFGFQFDDLETADDYDSIIHPRPTSQTIYKTLNIGGENVASTSGHFQTKNSDRPSSSTLSKMFGSSLMKKFGNKLSRRHTNVYSSGRKKSFTDIASGFEASIAQMRQPESLRLRFKFPTEADLSEKPFSENLNKEKIGKRRSSSLACAYQSEGYQNQPDSLYSILLHSLSDLPPSDYMSDSSSLAEIERAKKALESQEELISAWSKAINEFNKPQICPHVFNQRQIQYLSQIIKIVSISSPNMIQIVKTSRIPAWEISGDILRTVLHQMRLQIAESETLKEKLRPTVIIKSKSQNHHNKEKDENKPKKSTLSMKFSWKRKRQAHNCQHDFVKGHNVSKNDTNDNGIELADAQFALEEPEIAATNRLLEWLWNLRCSEIGRLSIQAYNYIEQLYNTSLVNSYFLEQHEYDVNNRSMALKSAISVSRIMSNLEYPVSAPLLCASKKGWLWAEMVLSLASWNNEKGYIMKASIPIEDANHPEGEKFLERVLILENPSETFSTLTKKPRWQENIEPDLDAATLAFHSEMATPIGWNDFEDPRRPGPVAVPILIFSSTNYYRKWEECGGNILHVLVRLQKFNSLQNVGQMLNPPHKKTALNEMRKLNKSLSFRIYDFDDNVMSKTFRRITSLRATRRRLMRRENATTSTHNSQPRKYYSCSDVGCKTENKETVITVFNGSEFECTKL